MRLRDTRPFRAARYRIVRALGAIVALVIAGHALVKVLVSSSHNASDWEYLGLSLLVALAVWLVALRAAHAPGGPGKRS